MHDTGVPPPSPGQQASSPSKYFTNIVRLESVDSTNGFAKDAAAQGAEGLVVVADVQTAGRGRRGRTWMAPRGSSLLCSLLFRPALRVDSLHLVTSAVALATLDAVVATTNGRARLKWPNDVIIDERKLAGLLAEVVDAPVHDAASSSATTWPALIVGVGLNLSWPSDWPPASDDEEMVRIAATATTLQRATGFTVKRDVFLDALLDACERRYARLFAVGGARVTLDAYRDACATIGERVRVELADESFEATALEISDDGRLIVEHAGKRIELDVADVVHLRVTS